MSQNTRLCVMHRPGGTPFDFLLARISHSSHADGDQKSNFESKINALRDIGSQPAKNSL